MSKTALITGASRGIGESIARKLASEGYNLFLICHTNIEKMNALKKELEDSFHISCNNYCGDVSDSSFINNVFLNIQTLDLLVNNAGIAHISLLQDMSDDEWHKVIDTNLSSVFYTCRNAIKLMLPQKSGSIINISSMWGTAGASMEVAYSASKGGVNSLTRALAKELAPSNISVNAIACGVIDTDMNRCFSSEERRALEEDIPSGRFATPGEVADTVYMLANSTTYLTGQVIGLDGGYL